MSTHTTTHHAGAERALVGGRDDGLRHDGSTHDGSDPDNAAHDPSGQTGSPQDDMLTVPIPARPVVTTFDAASRHERIEVQPVLVRRMRRAVTGTFGLWVRLSTAVARKLDWFPRVDPYVGYGTEVYSRLICRTVYAPKHSNAGTLTRGIKGMLAIPASRVQVRISIDGTPLETVQIGESERYDEFNPVRDLGSEYAVSDESGYLDLVAEHQLETGVHRVTYRVKGRPEVSASLFTIPSSAKVGIISDVDDTVMVTQAPILWKAAYNLLFLNPNEAQLRAGHERAVHQTAGHVPRRAVLLPVDVPLERGRIDPAFHLVSRLPRRTAAVARPRPAPEDVRAVRSAAQAGVRRTAHGGLPRHAVHPDRR